MQFRVDMATKKIMSIIRQMLNHLSNLRNPLSQRGGDCSSAWRSPLFAVGIATFNRQLSADCCCVFPAVSAAGNCGSPPPVLCDAAPVVAVSGGLSSATTLIDCCCFGFAVPFLALLFWFGCCATLDTGYRLCPVLYWPSRVRPECFARGPWLVSPPLLRTVRLLLVFPDLIFYRCWVPERQSNLVVAFSRFPCVLFFFVRHVTGVVVDPSPYFWFPVAVVSLSPVLHYFVFVSLSVG
ncbi:uncharacterized protein LOC115433894 [Sphaeramia orbicularis]|uniref:uncharacterized protein LOC115433894 n=1 Tax=Sphaeramia orbicularis TaxID=375764 RepID=UPI00117EA6F5|nr:uncharacterized protein LOC115433894 [Sphaeramia orbicularis]